MNLKQTVTLTVMLHTQQTEQVIAEGYHAEEYEIYRVVTNTHDHTAVVDILHNSDY